MGGRHQVALQIPATALYTAALYSGNGRIIYRSFRETTGAAAAQVDIYDGSNDTGPLIDQDYIAQSTVVRQHFLPHGLEFHNGLFIDVDSGTLTGSIVIVPEHEWENYCRIPVVVNIPIDELAARGL